MRARLLLVAGGALLASGCSAIRLGGPPPAPPAQLAGRWSGFLEVEGQQILGTLIVTQKGRDLGVTFTSNGLIESASGNGKVGGDGAVRMELEYTTQCAGQIVLAGGTVAANARLEGTVSATDCTGNARGGFTFSRQ